MRAWHARVVPESGTGALQQVAHWLEPEGAEGAAEAPELAAAVLELEARWAGEVETLQQQKAALAYALQARPAPRSRATAPRIGLARLQSDYQIAQ